MSGVWEHHLSHEGEKGAPKRDRFFVVFIFSDDFELHA